MPCGWQATKPLHGETAFLFDPEVLSVAHRLEALLKCPRTPGALVPVMLEDWGQKHAAILHNACEAVVEEPQDPAAEQHTKEKPPCWTIGFCICGASGDQLSQLRKRFLAMMSLTFKQGSEARTRLVQCDIVVRLSGRRVGAADELAAELLALQGRSAQGFDQDVYWHICNYNLSPREPTVRELKPLSDDQQTWPNELAMLASTKSMYDWHAFKTLDLDAAWSVTLYTLVESARPVDQFLPMFVFIEKFMPDTRIELWPPPRQRKGDPLRVHVIEDEAATVRVNGFNKWRIRVQCNLYELVVLCVVLFVLFTCL